MEEAGIALKDNQSLAEYGQEMTFKMLLQDLPVAVYTCNRDGYITFYNECAEKLWGRAPQIGKDLWCGSWRILRQDKSALPLEDCPMARVLKTGEHVLPEEIIIERPDGTKINVIAHPRPVIDIAGNLLGAVNLLTDITDRKLKEEQAARLATIVESSVAAIISKTLEGIVTSWNLSAERIFGYTEKEMIGESITKLIPHDKLEEEPYILEQLRKGNRIEFFETQRITKEGKLLDVSLTISPIKNDRGEIIGASKIVRDITGIKESERLIREGEERFRMAVEATKLGVWDHDIFTGELKVSPELKKIYGFPDSVVVTTELFSKPVHPEDAAFVFREMEMAMVPGGKDKYDIQFRITRFSDGEIRWIRSQGKVYFSAQHMPARFIGTVLDITDDKRAKEELEKMVGERTKELRLINEQLKQSNSELEQFASVASHDLQEPLRKIQMFSDLISKNRGDEDVFEKYFPKIISAASRMSRLIKDVLHYSRLNHFHEGFTEVDLGGILDNVLEDLEVLIEERRAVIDTDALPVIRGNPSQLHQLFSNLIGNSIKFSAQQPVITIRSKMLSYGQLDSNQPHIQRAEKYLQLEFSDNGIGFDRKFADQVFIIFQRLDDLQQYSGTGIGLAICKKVVENHGGTIIAESEPGRGTVFTIQLPAG